MTTFTHILRDADLEATLAATKKDERISSALIILNTMASFAVAMGGLHWMLGAIWP